ncbi:hypothetical protein JM93_03210 [Roseibium hamelinense]|uniref:Uncharacterized protein n=1 Tax=Roseibium hamelinense TaxID=150831 RepID=A0A562SPT0_9HYPH|nr:hypothetical protein JM93_03210 [Roseibium hamelinense]
MASLPAAWARGNFAIGVVAFLRVDPPIRAGLRVTVTCGNQMSNKHGVRSEPFRVNIMLADDRRFHHERSLEIALRALSFLLLFIRGLLTLHIGTPQSGNRFNSHDLSLCLFQIGTPDACLTLNPQVSCQT